MKGIIVKSLQCTAVLAFCFSANGMLTERFECPKGYRPISLTITFNSPKEAVIAMRRGIVLEHQYTQNGQTISENISFSFWRVRSANIVYNENGKVVNIDNIIYPEKHIKLICSLRDAFSSGVYVLTCKKPFLKSKLCSNPASMYDPKFVMLRFKM